MLNKPDFDKFAQKYDQYLNDTIPEHLSDDRYFSEYKIALMAAHLRESNPKKILDFGCGTGRSLPFLEKYFPSAKIYGYDVSPESLKLAKIRSPNTNLFSKWSSNLIGNFDVIVAANVFHHIPLEFRQSSIQNCRQLLAHEGVMFIFEHNPYNPLTRWVFNHCPFDIDAEMLSLKAALMMAKKAGFSATKHGYTLFFPRPLAFLRTIEPLLSYIPAGAQYYIKMYK